MACGTNIDQYRKSSVSSASPLRLVVMLYDGAVRFMEAGKHAMNKGDVYAQNENIQKAQSIIAELLARWTWIRAARSRATSHPSTHTSTSGS